MVSPVWARVLVPEAHHVAQLVNYDPEFVAVLPDGDCLTKIIPVTNCYEFHVSSAKTGDQTAMRPRLGDRNGGWCTLMVHSGHL